jgi:uncharacterized protein (TIGR02466 family)
MAGHIQLFPTPVWGFTLPDAEPLVQRCTDALRALRDADPGVQKSNLMGWQSHDELHLEEPFRSVANFVELFAERVVLPEYDAVRRFELVNLWGNINPPRAANLGHTHEHALSGAFYLVVPPESGKLGFVDPRVRNMGQLGEAHVFDIAAQPGGGVLFPAWLEHFVHPNASDEERFSLAFNLKAELIPLKERRG